MNSDNKIRTSYGKRGFVEEKIVFDKIISNKEAASVFNELFVNDILTIILYININETKKGVHDLIFDYC